jgi:hypothetical protein
MPKRVRILAVRDQDRAELERRARGAEQGRPGTGGAAGADRVAVRAGPDGSTIADRVGCTEPTVVLWRKRYAASGIAGLDDAPRPGGPVTVRTREVTEQILADTLTPPPGRIAGSRGDAVVGASIGGLAGPSPRDQGQPRPDRRGVEAVQSQTPPQRGVQVLHRPRAGDQDP